MTGRRLAIVAAACLALGAAAALAAGCIDVVQGSDATLPEAGSDAVAPVSDGASSLDSSADASGDANIGDGGSVPGDDVCPAEVFAANFDTVSDPASNWSATLNGAVLADGGFGTGGTISLVEGETTPPSAVEFASFAQDRPRGAAAALVRSVSWDGSCIGMAFDLFAPVPSGGGLVGMANIAPFTDDAELGLLLDTAASTAPAFKFYASTQLDGGIAPLDIGTVVVSYARWYRITMTLRRQSAKLYAVRVVARPSDGTQNLASFDAIVTTSGAPRTATIALGAVQELPSTSRVIADTVSLTASP
jgi:hypothetical protein